MNESFRDCEGMSEGQWLREKLDETIERLGIHLTAIKRTSPVPIITTPALTLTPTPLEPKRRPLNKSLRHLTTIYHNKESSMFLTCSSEHAEDDFPLQAS